MRVKLDPHLLAKNTARALEYYAEGKHMPLTVSEFVGLFAPFDSVECQQHLVLCRDGIIRVRRSVNHVREAVNIERNRC